MSDVTTTTTVEPTAQPFKLNGTACQVLASYLKDRVSGDADAPHRGLPFITEKGILRVKPSDWLDWFAAEKPYQGDEPSKTEMLKVLKDAGLVQRVYPLPAHDAHPELKGKSFGLYTAAAPSGTKSLPRVPARVAERKAPAPTADAVKDAVGQIERNEEASAKLDGPRKVPAGEVKVGDEVAQAKKGPFHRVASLSPGATAVHINFEQGGSIRPRKVTQVWVA